MEDRRRGEFALPLPVLKKLLDKAGIRLGPDTQEQIEALAKESGMGAKEAELLARMLMSELALERYLRRS
jgi:hypothetical protein